MNSVKINIFYVDTHLVGTLNNFTTYNLKLVDKINQRLLELPIFRNLFWKSRVLYENFSQITLITKI